VASYSPRVLDTVRTPPGVDTADDTSWWFVFHGSRQIRRSTIFVVTPLLVTPPACLDRFVSGCLRRGAPPPLGWELSAVAL